MNDTPKPPYGYRIIGPSDRPLKEGDKFWISPNWVAACHCNACSQLSGHCRPIDPGEGNEIVPEDGFVGPWTRENRQESTTDGINWTVHTWGANTPVKEAVRICAEEGIPKKQILAFRRRKQPVAQSVASDDGWIKVSERLPEPFQPIWSATLDRTVRAHSTGFGEPDNLAKFEYTHWQPLTPPKPPKPELSAEELAWQKTTNHGLMGFATPRDAFSAGFKLGKEAK